MSIFDDEFDKIIADLKEKLQQLLSAPRLSFGETLKAKVPKEKGIYRILKKSRIGEAHCMLERVII
ncbi:MAG: hypothetical protein ACE5K8_09305 [Candidatus Zixiibacteriota bacterium]